MNTKISVIPTTEFHTIPLNENALLFSYGNVLDTAINKKIITLHEAILKNPFPGFIESVPAYASLAVFFNVVIVKKNQPRFDTAFEFVQQYLLQLLLTLVKKEGDKIAAEIIIPVYYNGEDLDYVAQVNQLTKEEVIQIHCNKTYRVFMTGFLPGFAYMGIVDERICTDRKEKPRLHVAAGSVGIAGAQTGIYPIASPGGWQIIGSTPLRLFDKTKNSPCLLKAGDMVKFSSIDKNEFEKLNEY